MTPESVERYIKAGKTIRDIRRSIGSIVHEGKSFLEICEAIEETIRKKGCEPAFPCNIGVNEIAAHYTASLGDKNAIPEGAVVKLDLGAHLDGYLADAAVTVLFNQEYESMLRAAEEALERAIKIISPGTRIRDVSRTIQTTIEAYGYRPVSNLCGHQVASYIVHTSPSIPNVVSPLSFGKFEKDCVYAVEPFVTTKDAAGIVVDGPCGNIYHLAKHKRPKDRKSRGLLIHLNNTYKTLPFTTRWLYKENVVEDTKINLERLIMQKHIKDYPILYEQTGKTIVQAEHSLLLTEKETIILT